MSSSARALKRKQDQQSITAQELTPEQQKLPSGRLITDPLRGVYTSFPLLAWVARQRRTNIPLITLTLVLMSTDGNIAGVLKVEIPVIKGETDAAAMAFLQRYGWKGDIWFEGALNWPTGDEENAEQIKAILSDVENLRATFTFPPTAEGALSQEIEVLRARGDFLMPPFPAPEEPVDEALLTRFHELCDDLSIFYKDGKSQLN